MKRNNLKMVLGKIYRLLDFKQKIKFLIIRRDLNASSNGETYWSL